jgi:transmembrane sensor
MPITRLAYLFQKYFDKTATPEERAEFMQLAKDDMHAAELQQLMEQAWVNSGQPDPLTGEMPDAVVFDAGQSRSIWEKVLEQTKADPSGFLPVRRRGLLTVIRGGRMAAAAAVLAVVLGGVIWWEMRHKPEKVMAAAVMKGPAVPPDIAPGGNRATLVLGDGSVMPLDSTQKGMLALQGATKVVQSGSGKLVYDGEKAGKDSALVLMNTVRTARGGQYQVALPDGSKVWLDAASSLRFPTAFTGKERVVELTGEAYFEIQTDKEKPFRVKVRDMTVDVLGTHFNIMAYEEEESIQTCLLQGAVRVEAGAAARVLKPGQEVRWVEGGRGLSVDVADTDRVVAWKNGLFQFEEATLETVMHSIGRWYDVDVRYDGAVSRHFTGLIPRSATLTEVLHMLNLVGKARFSLEGRTIVVKP